MRAPERKEGLWGLLEALLDPKAPSSLRLRGLRLYAGFLLVLQGGVLLLLAWVVPRASHPFLWALALAGGVWLFAQAEAASRTEESLAPLLAVGLGAALFFFLGVMGLLLWPWGFLLLLLGALGFAHSWRRSERILLGRNKA
ncbi:hypothetical protein CSW29_12250 [Thermus scotoductus]|uniref:Uncharacterized protein n=1 Tax=Thermus scotoductus TaxID=37636 RepID=A0A430RJ03_THESC|nr:hypothetical protein [Thermus scotoductus]RTH14799.1 hypothetical protein CSW41_11545 [Thermus scotoductus]RTH97010.1 hypothetical protein CSW29_12250 [Thermus scotoductus]